MDNYATFTTRVLADGRVIVLRWVHQRATGAALAVPGLPPESLAFDDDAELIAASLGPSRA